MAVDAASVEDVGIYHTATQYLDPSGMFTEAATLAAAKVTRDIDLGTRLGEGELRRTQTYLGIGAKPLFGEE